MTLAEMARKWARSFHSTCACIDEPKVGLVDQRARLQSVFGALAHHADVRQPVQFVVDQGNDLVQGGLIAAAPDLKQQRHFPWGSSGHGVPCQNDGWDARIRGL